MNQDFRTLLEAFDNIPKRTVLSEAMLMEDPIYRDFKRVGLMLAERKMSEEEILNLFAQIEKGVTAGGQNRTFLGKGKDLATSISDAYKNVANAISRSTLVSGFDTAFDKLTDKIANGVGGQDGRVMGAIKKYREFAKAHPFLQGAIYAGMIALTGLSGAGLGGAALLGGIKMFDKLMLGNKLSSSLWSGIKTGGAAYAVGQAKSAWDSHNAVTAGEPRDPRFAARPAPTDPNAPLSPDTTGMHDPTSSARPLPGGDTTGMHDPADAARPLGGDGTGMHDPTSSARPLPGAGNVPTGGGVYSTVPGDNMSTLAAKLHVSTDELSAANPSLANVHKLPTGFKVNIPDATGSAIYKHGVGTASGAVSNAARLAAGVKESVVGYRVRRIPMKEMVDRHMTVFNWNLNESLNLPMSRSYQLTEAGIDNVFKNVELYQRHVFKLLEAAPLKVTRPSHNPGDAGDPNTWNKPKLSVADKTVAPTTPTGPGREQIPGELRPDMPDAAKKPGFMSRAWSGIKNLGHQFTTKLTADKLKMNWHVKGKPTDSDAIAAFLLGEKVPASVIKDIYSQLQIDIPQEIVKQDQQQQQQEPQPVNPVEPVNPVNPNRVRNDNDNQNNNNININNTTPAQQTTPKNTKGKPLNFRDAYEVIEYAARLIRNKRDPAVRQDLIKHAMAVLKNLTVADRVAGVNGAAAGDASAAPVTVATPAPVAATPTRTGGRVAGNLSTNPRAVKRRDATAAKKAAVAAPTTAPATRRANMKVAETVRRAPVRRWSDSQ